ncbi:hypothetical protein EDC04DRAFT_157093 [Pisolithus marmoratus]|nr:hypothetical protein EDC04DRAFT_157093 [Pisolithus marmoratus]
MSSALFARSCILPQDNPSLLMSFSGRNLLSYLENEHQSRLAESYGADPPVLAVPTRLLWGPTLPESFPHDSHSTDGVEGHGDSTNGIETSKSSRSQRSCALADDERSIRCTEDMLGGWECWRASFVLGVIQTLLRPACSPFCCSKVRALWLRILEGITDDDVWLWVDGDEEWFREKRVPCGELTSERVDAQSALRRRIAQQRYPTVTGIHGGRNERIRNATPKQRVCAIVWLIASSKGDSQDSKNSQLYHWQLLGRVSFSN